MVAGMDSLFVDTSGWIEVFGKNNPFHKGAREILELAIDEHRLIITTNYVIAEFIGRGGGACNLPRQALLAVVDSILDLPNIEVVHIGEKSHAVAITLLHNHLDKEWSLVDATSFNVMRERKILEALTIDHHFEQAGFIKLP